MTNKIIAQLKPGLTAFHPKMCDWFQMGGVIKRAAFDADPLAGIAIIVKHPDTTGRAEICPFTVAAFALSGPGFNGAANQVES